MTAHATREAWLEAAIDQLRPMFTELGHDVPTVRVSVGWPGGKGNRASTIGQCWPPSASTDDVGQVFISPVLDDAPVVLSTLTHELVHAINHRAGESGHGRPFAKIAKALGLEGRMTSTHAGEALQAKLAAVASTLGEFPHARLASPRVETLGKKQGTRMLKVSCPTSGYIVRTTRSWLDEYGTPICPCHETRMEEAR